MSSIPTLGEVRLLLEVFSIHLLKCETEEGKAQRTHQTLVSLQERLRAGERGYLTDVFRNPEQGLSNMRERGKVLEKLEVLQAKEQSLLSQLKETFAEKLRFSAIKRELSQELRHLVQREAQRRDLFDMEEISESSTERRGQSGPSSNSQRTREA